MTGDRGPLMASNLDSEVPESEEELVVRAQTAISRCNWVVGECAVKWTVRYAEGRTDADFAALVGLSPDQVFQRRRVWETFGDVYKNYPSLRWSHFYVSLRWEDALDCLQWAVENGAAVAEMKAWRRAIRGEDLTAEAEPDEWGGDPAVTYVPSEVTAVRDPAALDPGVEGQAADATASTRDANEPVETLAGVAREAEAPEGEYAPFRQGAGSPAPAESSAGTSVAEKPNLSSQQLLRRLTMTVDRLNRALTPELIQQIRRLPQGKRERLVQVVAELSTKTAKLM